jgi:glycyl-tRNA synthetase
MSSSDQKTPDQKNPNQKNPDQKNSGQNAQAKPAPVKAALVPGTKKLGDLATMVSLCKRRGFVYQSSEIYGGLNSCWDYGPLGSNLKMNVKQVWWNAMTRRDDVVGLDAAILMAPMVWKASGHIDGFSDPLVDCKKCKQRFRADQLPQALEASCKENCKGAFLTEPRSFNLMFKTFMGPLEDESAIVYLRPETAQGIFVNFDNVQTTTRKKIPFGIAQIGKSFRNEITPGNFTFRTREFEQMEMQYFVKPGTDESFFEKWKETRWNFYLKLGMNPEKLRFKPHGPDELAHYAKAAVDVQYEFPFGWQELEGVHNRSDFDLSQHQKFSGKKLEYFDEVSKEKFLPFVIETAVGCDRLILALLCDAYREENSVDEETGREDTRVVLGFHPEIAPIKAAILPLSKKAELIEPAMKLRDQLAKEFSVQYDDAASIGKRYRRQDEIGTPFCMTYDFDSNTDLKVTVRERDSMKQERVALDQIETYIKTKMKEKSIGF